MPVLVSVIMSAYNAEQYIEIALGSVLKQTMNSYECIIVDDCSTDGTIKVLDRFKDKDVRFKVIQNAVNLGAGLSRNRGIKIAQGKYITFLDSDDVWHEKKLERHINFMEENGINFSHCSYGYIDEKGRVSEKVLRVSKGPINYEDLLKRTEISCLTAIYNSQELGKLYMPNLRVKQDYALWLDILKTGISSYPLDEVLAWYRQVPNSNTSNKFRLIRKHYVFLREHEQLSHFNSLVYTLYWALNGVIRYYF